MSALDASDMPDQPQPPAFRIQDEDALIAALRQKLVDAVAEGDEQARLFLEGTFDPWAPQRLAGRMKS